MMHVAKESSVLAMTAEDRLAYFVRKVCDFEEVWGLFDNGWSTSTNDDGKLVASFWPERDFAALCVTGKWAEYSPRSIGLAKFMESWLPGLENDDMLIGVFQTPDDRAAVMEPSALLDLLEQELATY